MVLNDITTLRRLENVRREFVSNASHELRTPITSIKGLLRDGTGVLANHDRYARSVTAEGVELRKYATEGNTLPSNFHHRHTRLKVGPRLPRNPRSVYGKICGVLGTHPGVTGEKLVELLLSVDFSDNPSAYTQSGRVSLPWLAKYIDGGFYEKNQCIQAWEPSDNIAQVDHGS